jgi:hypothetical protein
MVGRPKNPNRPPTITAVRITERTQRKLLEEHMRFNSHEPFNNTIERALDELIALRKKVKALDLELNIEGLQIELRTKELANTNLINILKRRDDEIESLKKERKAAHKYAEQELA